MTAAVQTASTPIASRGSAVGIAPSVALNVAPDLDEAERAPAVHEMHAHYARHVGEREGRARHESYEQDRTPIRRRKIG